MIQREATEIKLMKEKMKNKQVLTLKNRKNQGVDKKLNMQLYQQRTCYSKYQLKIIRN